MRFADQRADVRGVVERIADAQLLGRLCEAGNEFVVNRSLDENARAAEADLALIPEAGADGSRDRLIQIGVREDEIRILAAELQ